MIHHGKQRSLSRTKKQRVALIRSLAVSLIEHEHITTSHAKAKVLQPFIDRLISHAKSSERSSLSKIQSMLSHKPTLRKLHTTLSKRYTTRTSGFTRMTTVPPRTGDQGKRVRIELV